MTMTRGTLTYLLRRLHSLSGILPLTVFIGTHYWTNAHALGGAESFNKAVANLHEMPYLWAAEIGIVFAPLIFHSIYGLFITMESKPNVEAYPFYQNFAYTAQRVTGILLTLFIIFHLYETRWQQLMFEWGIGGAEVDYSYMAAYFSAGWVKVIYTIGIASVAYHVGNGLFNFAFKWGIVVSPKAQRAMIKISAGAALLLFAVGMNILYAFQ
jgi:succinate dehydrogenase / fumarate reductase, cytochrome b subunit